MASNTSNILLSNNTFCDGHCYEIVLRDFKSSIVTKYPQFYAENKTSLNMLSTFDPMPVEIIQKNDGELIVNVPGYAEPLVKYLDPKPVISSFLALVLVLKPQQSGSTTANSMKIPTKRPKRCVTVELKMSAVLIQEELQK
ncbi:uncharacterized protein LOC129907677 [Episyrphus balteatus]|uniref:uncharacterized protein LOC129907677 n=1 Tax=Episyrphus balteatus TaxID=286459 RepID=UPI002484DFFA|nr:uncharacterized protein LOC129907677 [Episyrphus balteatus]